MTTHLVQLVMPRTRLVTLRLIVDEWADDLRANIGPQKDRGTPTDRRMLDEAREISDYLRSMIYATSPFYDAPKTKPLDPSPPDDDWVDE